MGKPKTSRTLPLYARLLLLFTSPQRRIARALEDLRDLYEMDLNQRGIYRQHKPTAEDRVELMYGPQTSQRPEDG